MLLIGVTDGWFDDPIGLSATAYILVPPIALSKSLLARPYLSPWIKLLPEPRAYASPPHWLLLSMTKPHSHAPLRHINNPPQHAYALSPDWSPQSHIYGLFVLRASYPTARSPSLFFPSARRFSRITHRPTFLLRG